MAFHDRTCTFNLDRPDGTKLRILVQDGFLSLVDAHFAFGETMVADPPEGRNDVHLSFLLIGLVKKRGVWKAQKLRVEMESLLFLIGIHFEAALDYFNLVPLRMLPEIEGFGAQARVVADVQRKEEMMQTARRAGALMTATRLLRAVRAWEGQVEKKGAGPAAKPPQALAAEEDLQPKLVEVFGACAYFSNLELVPVVKPVVGQAPEPREDFEGFVMGQYNHATVTGMPPGCLHVAADGLQAKTTGEINQYFALAPPQPALGKDEVSAWLPIQVSVCASTKRTYSIKRRGVRRPLPLRR